MAEYSDGSIVVDTEIDTEGFLKDSKKLNQALTSLSGQFSRIGQQMKTAIAKNNTAALETLNRKFVESQSQAEALRKKLDAFSRIKILNSEYVKTTAELEKVDEKFQNLIDRQEKLDRLGVSHDSAQWKSLQDDIEATGKKYDELKAARDKMESEGTAYKLGEQTSEYKRLSRQLDETVDGAERLVSSLNNAGRGSQIFYGILYTVRYALSSVGKVLHVAANGLLSVSRHALNAARNLAKVTGGAILSGFGKLGSAIKNAAGGLFSLLQNSRKTNSGLQINLRTILRYGLGIRSLYMLFNKLRSAVTDAFGNMSKKIPEVNKSLSSLASSLDRLKNSLGTAFQPILTVIAPYLKQFMDMLSNALTKVGMFFAALTGQQYVYKATQTQVDYAKSLDKTTQSAKKAENQLAKFDDLNILQDTSKSSSDSGSTPTGSFEKIPIESSIADFMSRLKSLFEKGDFSEIGGIIADKLNGIFEHLDDLISWENIGDTITRIVTAITDGINGFVDRLDWDKIGRTFGSAINTLANTIYLFFTQINWEKIGAGLARGMNSLVKRVDWEKLGRTFGAKLNALIKTIHGFVSNFNWGNAGIAFGKAVKGLIDEVDWDMLADDLVKAINGAIKALKSFVNFFEWGEYGTGFADGINKLIDEVDWDGLGGLLADSMQQALTFLYNAVSRLKWGAAGIKFANALNTFFANKRNWTLAGKTIDTSIKGLLDFTKKMVITFDEEQFAEDIKALFHEVDWAGIARDTWSLIKTTFAKAGNFLDVLFSDSSAEEAKKRADSSAYWSAYADELNSKSLGTKIGEKLAKAINFGVKNLPVDDIGDALDKALNGVLDFAVSLVKNFDPDTFREKLEEALGRVDWDAVARKMWLAVKDALAALAKATPIIGELINKFQSELSADDVASALRQSLDGAMEEIAEYGYVKGGGLGENFYDGFRKKVLDESGNVKEEFRGRMSEMFSESEIEAFERGDMTVVEFYNGLGFGGLDGEGEATESLLSIIRGILDAPTEIAEDAGESTAGTLFSSYILKTLSLQPDAENAVEGAFNDIWNGLDANGYGGIIAFDYFNSFMGTVMDESGRVKPEFKDVVESMFGSVESLEDGKVDAEDFLRGLIKGMYDSSGETSTKLIDIIDGVLEKVRTDPDGLDEHSPSKRAEKFGEDFLKGFSGGVDNEENTTTSAVKSAFTTITDIAFAMLAMNLAVSLGMAAVKSTFTKKLGEIETSTKTTFESIKEDVATKLKNIKTAVEQGVEKLQDKLSSMLDKLDGMFPDYLKKYRDQFDDGWGDIVDVVDTHMSSIESAVTSEAENLESSLPQTFSDMGNAVRDQDWYSVGSNIVEGISNGINSYWPWLQSTVWNLAIDLYNTAKNALGIHSPSKLFRDGVGKMLGLGVAEGMEDSQPQILNSVSNVADAMADEMRDADVVANMSANDSNLDDVLSSFSDKVADSFSKLVERLEAIAESVTFRTPDTAAGTVVPYSVAGNASNNASDAHASSEEQISALIQMFNNQTTAIVRAIEENCGVDLQIGDKVIGDAAIREINRRARATGTSPIMV